MGPDPFQRGARGCGQKRRGEGQGSGDKGSGAAHAPWYRAGSFNLMRGPRSSNGPRHDRGKDALSPAFSWPGGDKRRAFARNPAGFIQCGALVSQNPYPTSPFLLAPVRAVSRAALVNT